MAICSSCQHYISPRALIMQSMVCPHCSKTLRFNKPEYRAVVRPGILIAIVVVANIQMTADPLWRHRITGALMVAWLFYTYRYIQYLKKAVLETDT